MKWYLCASAAALVVVGAPASGQQRAAAFSIPAGELSSALSTYSSVTGMQVIAAPALVQGRRTAGVSGRLTAHDALTRLLRGTGLHAVTSNGVLVLRAGQKDATPRRARHTVAAPIETPVSVATTEPQTDGPDVVVVGYRSALTAAQELKRRAVGTQDSIVASDIAAFPDLNLAEALQRVPGVAITRDTGEGRQIALRGLGPDFTRTQLNGMEVLGNTASGMDNRGNVSRTRGFDFSLFASELFNRVTVQKSFAANQEEGGIAGTVQLATAKPFDYDGPQVVLSAKGQHNDQTEGLTPRLVALFSQRQGDVGALVSIAYSKIRNNEYGYRNWNWGRVTYGANNIGPEIDANTRALLRGGTIFAPQAQSPSTWYTDRERIGATAALQYHPGDRFKLDVDLLYGQLSDNRDDWAIASGGYNALTGNVSGTQVIRSAVIEGNSLVAASYTGIDQRTEHHYVENETNFYQAVANVSWQASDRLLLTALAGYQKSDFAQPVFDKVFLQARNTAFSFDMRPTIPQNTYGFDLTNPANWNVQRLVAQENTITSEYRNAQVGTVLDISPALKLEAGGEYKRFTNAGYQYLTNTFYGTAATTDRAVPDSLKYVINRDSLLPYIGGDVGPIYALLGNNRNLTAANLTAGSDYNIRERTWAGFAQIDLDTDLGSMRLRGNAGVRYYNTSLRSGGSLATATNGVTRLEPVVVETENDGWLPAVNLALDITPQLVARASASRNVNRPGLPQLAAAGTLTVAPFGGTVSVGNPFLQPFRSTSVEGVLEWYMDRRGFASLGVFWKDLDSFITSETSQVPYSATGFPVSLLLPGQDGTTPYNYTRPINGEGAKIRGVEAAFQHDFTFLPAPFDRFGVVANGTYIDGDQNAVYNGVSQRIPLFNLSKWAANGTLYFETERFGARVSTAFRSRYLLGAGSNANVGDGIRPTNNVDFQIRYNLTPTVRLVAEGINITNEAIEQFADREADRTLVYTTSGRIYTLGVTASF
ncbi:TonB-dependent receptor [Sphingomonas guangdongensis]|uniref:TonB-dependent receptor n=1 Tax=Sphingomonas guangdongensis TaxID=1141890 RepID=A0A285QD77_9SPHN|nr:TonB-dependent receptor [Sphingomonas guangdongensis]SOB79444.1 TonB-dependent receptor [Sphingomonas guangdongensis]